ncbi:MAG: DUF2946 family protein [Pseudomonadota bacterium]|nr:DUF2946 family protein [Pseudomonadota bacterium]
MTTARFSTRLLTYLAIVALACQMLLLPAGNSGSTRWSGPGEICSATSLYSRIDTVRAVSAASKQISAPDIPRDSHRPHCPLCFGSAVDLAIPSGFYSPVIALDFPAARFRDVVSTVFYPLPLRVILPRGPPAVTTAI